jgi:hypothetical protein
MGEELGRKGETDKGKNGKEERKNGTEGKI